MAYIYNDITETIGNTPLVPMQRTARWPTCLFADVGTESDDINHLLTLA